MKETALTLTKTWIGRRTAHGLLLPAILVATPAVAHVELDEPNGGEVLVQGTQVEIQWHVAIMHGTENWDLAYSTTGGTGPWTIIAEDLPPGDITTSAMHSYLWTVPAEDSDSIRVRVTQDNSGTDYTDMSDEDLTIEPIPAEIFVDGFESGATSGWSAVAP
ncbi:MAG: hypothetical protein MPN21_11745 [Thermoanaerobaculia bacterium]|nr:hypothetical protein [Thermoanaerobaculia bacterium]